MGLGRILDPFLCAPIEPPATGTHLLAVAVVTFAYFYKSRFWYAPRFPQQPAALHSVDFDQDPAILCRFEAMGQPKARGKATISTTTGVGRSSFAAQSPGSSTMGPQTPAQPPPGPSRASDLGSVDAAAACDLPVGHRDLPRDPTRAVALFGDSDRYEWGLSEYTGLVGRRLADQF